MTCFYIRLTSEFGFCIAPGGQMAGKTIEEAHAACNTAHNKQQATKKLCSGWNMTSIITNATNTATTQPHSNSQQKITINRQHYMLVNQANATNSNSALSTITMPPYN